MKKMNHPLHKRLTALLLALVCVFGLIPTTAFAAGDTIKLKNFGYTGVSYQSAALGRGEFSTCAYIIIRNELYSALEYSTRRAAEMATDPAELPLSESGESLEQQMVCGDLLDRLERAEAAAGGVTARGFQAIRLLAQGYSSREIGERFGVQANHVTAWVAKARKQLALLA